MKQILHTLLLATFSCVCTFGGLMIMQTSSEASVAVKKLTSTTTCGAAQQFELGHHAAVVAGEQCFVQGNWNGSCTELGHTCHDAPWIGPGGDLDIMYGGANNVGYITNNP